MTKTELTHSGTELDQAISDWQNTLTPVYTLPPQVILSAVCNPTVPCVNLAWKWIDTEFAAGIVIRRKLGEIPESVNDGDLVCNITGVETVTFADEDFDAADSDSVGTIDEPVYWYYRAFPYNVNAQYQTNYQTSAEYGMHATGVYYLESGSLLSALSLEDTLIFGQHYSTGADLVWRIMDIQEDRVRLCLHYDQVASSVFDAPEPDNEDSNRVSYGSNRWSTSNIRQWLNADGASSTWFEAQTDTDVGNSSLIARNGFLYKFSDAEKNLIVPESHVCALPDGDGGGTETVIDTVWLMSGLEMGYTGSGYNDEGEIFQIFSGDNNTNSKRIENWALNHWTRSRVLSTEHQARFCNSGGYAGAYDASNTFSVRAGLSLPLNSYLTYDEDAAMFKVVAV